MFYWSIFMLIIYTKDDIMLLVDSKRESENNLFVKDDDNAVWLEQTFYS